MPTFHFSVVLKSPTTLTENLADRLFAAGCDDALCSSSGGVDTVDFIREATDLETPVRLAIANVTATDSVVSPVDSLRKR